MLPSADGERRKNPVRVPKKRRFGNSDAGSTLSHRNAVAVSCMNEQMIVVPDAPGDLAQELPDSEEVRAGAVDSTGGVH